MAVRKITQKRKKPRIAGPAPAVSLRLPDPTMISIGELSKSSQTRKRIMDAAVDCLAQTGYAGTTTSSVAARAELTRTAMLYHFPSRLALMEAVIHYVMRERLRIYIDDLAAVALDDWDRIISVAWEQLQTNLFRAFVELLNASHTDMHLAGIFAPAFAEYDRGRREVAIETFPRDVIDDPRFSLRRDVVRYLMEGLAMQGGLSYADERRKTDLLNFLRALLADASGLTLLEVARNWTPGRPHG